MRAISLLCTWIIIFVNIFLVYTLCAEFRIEYTDLHIKAVLTVHHSSESVQWFGRESRTKPFLRLSFIYIEIIIIYYRSEAAITKLEREAKIFSQDPFG